MIFMWLSNDYLRWNQWYYLMHLSKSNNFCMKHLYETLFCEILCFWDIRLSHFNWLTLYMLYISNILCYGTLIRNGLFRHGVIVYSHSERPMLKIFPLNQLIILNWPISNPNCNSRYDTYNYYFRIFIEKKILISWMYWEYIFFLISQMYALDRLNIN